MKMWEGDRLFLKALDERNDFFTLKLRYEGETSLNPNSADPSVAITPEGMSDPHAT